MLSYLQGPGRVWLKMSGFGVRCSISVAETVLSRGISADNCGACQDPKLRFATAEWRIPSVLDCDDALALDISILRYRLV
jgi:hypothetical protein